MSPPEWSLHGGSSPQMRGARASNISGAIAGRIIPADAGSTQCYILSITHLEDHPRRCGEHLAGSNRKALVIGSSPQMRGALRNKSDNIMALRIIPADAGSTSGKRQVLK